MVNKVEAYQADKSGKLFTTRLEAVLDDAEHDLKKALGPDILDLVPPTFCRMLLHKAQPIWEALSPVIVAITDKPVEPAAEPPQMLPIAEEYDLPF